MGTPLVRLGSEFAIGPQFEPATFWICAGMGGLVVLVLGLALHFQASDWRSASRSAAGKPPPFPLKGTATLVILLAATVGTLIWVYREVAWPT